MVGENRPLIARALSRMISAERRKRGPSSVEEIVRVARLQILGQLGTLLIHG